MNDNLLKLVSQLSVVAVAVYVLTSAIGRKDEAAIMDKIKRNLPGTGGKWSMSKGATPKPMANIPTGTAIL
jgi:hypothetical protein